jgi:hypothetical protein
MPGILTFLKKAGQIILEGAQIFTGFAPFLTSAIPHSQGLVTTVSKDLSQVADAVIQAEAIGQALSLPGPQKLQAAAPLVSQILIDSSIVAGKQIAQPDLFKQGSQKIADGMADVLNSLHPDSATQTKPQDIKPA